MYVVFLAGGLASGKSSVARELERLGAVRIDLDQVSRDVLAPGSATLAAVVDAFGNDLTDATTGKLDRALLARRAFATPEASARLEAIELPAIRARLATRLDEARATGTPCAVVEIPLLNKVGEAMTLADEVVAVCCPPQERLSRAVARGMDDADASARMANQPSEAWLRDHANTVINNSGSADELLARTRAWWQAHHDADWRCMHVGGPGHVA